MPIVRVPDGRKVRFPDDMPREQIKAFIMEKFPQQSTVSETKQTEKLEITPEVLKRRDELLKNAGIDTSFNSVNNAFADGFQQGYLGGAERAVNGATLGGYDWANDKLGLGSKERKKELEDLNSAIKYANDGTEFTAGLATGGGLFKGGTALAKAIPTATKTGKVTSNLARLGVYPTVGAIEGGLSSGFANDSFDKLKEGAVSGGVAGAVIPATLWGLGKGISLASPKILGMTTGSGDRAIKTAFDAGKRKSPVFLENMRGTANKEDVVDMAKNSLKDLKIAKNAEYTKAMSEIKGKEGIELKPILDKFKQISKTEAGGKKYLVDDDTAKFLKSAGKKISSFQKDKSVKTLSDFDNLKQSIGNINVAKDARRASQVQGELYNAIKDEIKKQAPVYDKIMKPYSQAADEIRNIEKSLSLGKGKEVDTALRKLQSAFRNNVASNYGNRGDLVNKLGNAELSDALSGQLLNSWLPRGLESRAGGLGLGFASAKGLTNPASLTAFSPRIVGESAYGLGKLSNLVNNVATPELKRATLMELIGLANRKGDK